LAYLGPTISLRISPFRTANTDNDSLGSILSDTRSGINLVRPLSLSLLATGGSAINEVARYPVPQKCWAANNRFVCVDCIDQDNVAF